jgi:hypothetical protein
MKPILLLITTIFSPFFLLQAAEPFNGFQNAQWGSGPDEVKKNNSPSTWQQSPLGNDFPKEMKITTYAASQDIAGKEAQVTYYFCDNKLFQATIRFNFTSLKNFDFNYNVYRSVDAYYRAIHEQTLTFVFDFFDLLRKKYGRKEPAFRGADPRYIFRETDEYLKKELWNLRSNPYDYFKKIKTSAYAQWDLPKTSIIFSIIIDAPEKRFDYQVSIASKILSASVNAQKDSLRVKNL